MKKKRAFQLSVVLFMLTGVTLLFSACYKDYGLSTADYDVVLTSYDEDVVFQEKSLYYLDPTIYNLDEPENDTPDPLPNEDIIKQAIKDELEAYGYVEVGDILSADVGIRIAYAETDYFYYYWYDPCWSWWSYCWYYPPGWGYPQYAYTAGTLFIQMGDLEGLPDGDILAMWFAGINGLLNDTSDGLVECIQDAITQAFAQSPYLEQ